VGKLMRYLMHNLFPRGRSDCPTLLAALPGDVEAVAWGPTAETEAARDAVLANVGCGVSVLPAVLFQMPETDGVPAHWREVRVADMPQPWTWDAIDAACVAAGWFAAGE